MSLCSDFPEFTSLTVTALPALAEDVGDAAGAG